MGLRTPLTTLAVLAVAAGSLSACGSQSSPAASSRADTAASTHLDKDGLLSALQKSATTKTSVHVAMTLSGRAAVKATGDVSSQGSSPEASISVSAAQLGSGSVELRAVDHVLYVKVPPLTPAGKFLKIDPHAADSPFGQSMGGLRSGMDPRSSLGAIRKAITAVTYDGQDTVTGVSTDHYTVTVSTTSLRKAMHASKSSIPGAMAGGMGALGGGSAAHVPATISYDLWLDAQQRPRQLRFALSGERALVQLTKWGEPVTVTAPPASQVVKHPGFGSLGNNQGSRRQGTYFSWS